MPDKIEEWKRQIAQGMFTVVAAGWYSDETDELEFDDTANAEYTATNDEPYTMQNYLDDIMYYPDEIGI